MPPPEDVHAGPDGGAGDGAEVRTATGDDRTELERLAGCTSRVDPPATGGGGRRPTIPS